MDDEDIPRIFHGSSFSERLNILNVSVIKSICRRGLPPKTLSSVISRTKEILIAACIQLNIKHPIRLELEQEVRRKEALIIAQHNQRREERASWKMKESEARKAQAWNEDIVYAPYNPEIFMKVLSPEEHILKNESFFIATSKSNIFHRICGSCGRCINEKAYKMTEFYIDMIPNGHRLQPVEHHVAQTLFGGMLLEPNSIFTGSNGGKKTCLCCDCRRFLQVSGEGPPPMSLANALWIGSTPIELQQLTLPEALLIAHIYPRVFVCKLWPKNRSGVNPDNLQSGLLGNVTSFEMNVPGIKNMLDGRLMPRRPQVLASLISITIISKFPLPRSWLKGTFRVRRAVIRGALMWLQVNNPKYYGGIVLDEDALLELPEDDVPDAIVNTVRREQMESSLDSENDSYVPTDPTDTRSEDQVEDSEATVIPLQFLGQEDVDLSKMSASELMAWGLCNMWKDGQEGGYAVRHGTQPVSTFQSLNEDKEGNYWERAFPTLFPYGFGGFEKDRPTRISLATHVQWALQYHDKRFRKHPIFPFAAFSILQRREALLSARVQMRRADFKREAGLLQSITIDRMKLAADQESRGERITDVGIRSLQKHLHAVAGRVKGTDASRIRLRSMMWSMSYVLNPPNMWITINPDDIDDPIVQFLAGEDIDLDNFSSASGPPKSKRSANVASDPYVAAQYNGKAARARQSLLPLTERRYF